DLSIDGHAVESRVYAEDPASNFLPDPGPLRRHAAPSGFGVRVDAGVEEGGEVLVHYDPMISKLTTWGRTRAAALDRMVRALDEYEVAGMATTIPFCRFAMTHEGFRDGIFTTHFVDDEFDPSALQADDAEHEALAALAATLYYAQTQEEDAPEITSRGDGQRGGPSPWRRRRKR
ncbi:MAG: biotin carboxylase, partial [Salinivenus sp.]